MISRALIVANSGGGKSWAVRSLLEETFGKVQHIVIDPEGEFHTLREKYPYILAAKTGGDVIASPKLAKKLCHRIMEIGASAILDLYELNPHERREFVKLFLEEMTNLPKSLWRPCIVVIDEAHQFAPESGRERDVTSTPAVINFISLARKRGFCPVLATQRISKLNKDAAAELNNKLIGRTGLDVDVKRAGDELGFDKEKRQTLPRLEPGTFYVYGPAISPEVTIARTGPVETTHPEPGQISAAPPPTPAKVKAMLAQLGDLPAEAEQEARTVEDLKRANADLSRQLRQAQKTGVEKVVEKVVVDERAVKRAVDTATKEQVAIIARLRKALESAMQFIVKINAAGFDAPGVDKAEIEKALQAAVARASELVDRQLTDRGRKLDALKKEASRIIETIRAVTKDEAITVSVDVARVAPSAAVSPSPRPQPIARMSREVSGDITKSEQKILDAIALANSLGIDQPERIQVAIFAGYTVNGHFNNMVGTLRTKGYVDYPGDGSIVLTEGGNAIATPADIRSLEQLHQVWLNKLSPSEQKILQALIDSYPSPLRRDDLAEQTGYTVNGHFNNMVGRLRTMGAVAYPGDGSVVAAKVLFPEGL
jgi:hypothetical protein